MKSSKQNTTQTLKPMSDDTTKITIQSLGPDEMSTCQEFDRLAGHPCGLEAVFLVSLSEGTNKTRKMCARDTWSYGLKARGLTL